MTQNTNAIPGNGAGTTPRQQAQAMVSAAVAASRVGDAALAGQLLETVLNIHPNHADALQLMGLLALQKGDFAAAEPLMRKSLASDDNQAHVHCNLANLLARRGNATEALRHYRRATELSPDYVDALVQLGELLVGQNDFRGAEAHLARAYALQPQSVAVIVAFADLRAKAGDRDGAESLLRGGLAENPQDVFLLNNLGMLLCEQLRHEEALVFLTPLAELAPNRPEVCVNLGNALIGAGRLEESLGCFVRAINLDPRNYFAHDNLNKTLWQLGVKEDVGYSYHHAKQVLPGDPDIWEMAAESAIAFKFLERAEADLVEAQRLRPGTMYQFRLWTALRLAQGLPLPAIAIAEAGLALLPDDPDLLRKLAEAQLMAGRPRKALAAANRLSRLNPFDQFAAAYQAAGHRLSGDDDAAHRLYDYDRFVYAVDLAAPAGYGDLAQYLEKLQAALAEFHVAVNEPIYQSLRFGTQTHLDLFQRPGIGGAIRQLGQSVLAEATRFAQSLPDDVHHPFLGRKTDRLGWAGSWSVRLRDGGHHVDHIHHKGWISGVYYVSVPDCLSDEVNKPGWLKFGEFRQDIGPSLSWEKAIRPRPGLLVLFPSYMWHGTLPISGDQERWTVSFDIVPAGA